jgi:hypothetical protein
MRGLAGNRGIDAARDARTAAGVPVHETSAQTKRRKLHRAAVRTRAYLNVMRRD